MRKKCHGFMAKAEKLFCQSLDNPAYLLNSIRYSVVTNPVMVCLKQIMAICCIYGKGSLERDEVFLR